MGSLGTPERATNSDDLVPAKLQVACYASKSRTSSEVGLQRPNSSTWPEDV